MRSLIRSHIPCALLTLLLLPAACSSEPEIVGGERAVTWNWPDGDSAAGMQAFEDLQCFECHRVDSIPELAALDQGGPGPALGAKTARRPRVEILIQIVAPGTDPAIQESHMRSFSDVMTVDQLTNLIALVESLHEEGPTSG